MNRELRDGLDVFAGDTCDPDGVRKAMNGRDAEPLAALIVISTLNVLQAACDRGVSRPDGRSRIGETPEAPDHHGEDSPSLGVRA